MSLISLCTVHFLFCDSLVSSSEGGVGFMFLKSKISQVLAVRQCPQWMKKEKHRSHFKEGEKDTLGEQADELTSMPMNLLRSTLRRSTWEFVVDEKLKMSQQSVFADHNVNCILGVRGDYPSLLYPCEVWNTVSRPSQPGEGKLWRPHCDEVSSRTRGNSLN